MGRGATLPRRALALIAVLVALQVPGSTLRAQDQSASLRAQRDTLLRLRREREVLERRAVELQNTVHDLDEEVTNLDRRAEATAHLVEALDAQLAAINNEVSVASKKAAAA